MAKERLIQAIGVTRAAIGVAVFVAPRVCLDRAGLPAASNPQAPYLARIAGARDLGLGLGVLAAGPQARRGWALTALGCDAADAIAGAAGWRGGYLETRTGAIFTGTAIGAVLLGAISLR
jgi:hypothetical protein